MTPDLIERQVFEFAADWGGWPRLIGVFVIAFLCWSVIGLYRREARGDASRLMRVALGVLRCAVLVALAIILLRPALVTYVERTTPARVVVLVDASASMQLRDPGEAASRFDRVRARLLSPGGDWVGMLADRNQVVAYRFGANVVPADAADAALPSAASLDGRGTAPGNALRTALEDAAGQPLAAVILISDGQFNDAAPLPALATLAQERRAPIHTIGVGVTDEPLNLLVNNLSAPEAAPLGDPIELRLEVSATGLTTPLEAEVSLTESSVDGTDATTRETRIVQLTPSEATAVVTLPIALEEAGRRRFTARISGPGDELLAQDNVADALTNVLDDPLRVLVVAGRPSFDYRFLVRLLQRDATIDLSTWLQSADERALRDGDTLITEFPATPDALFEYDVLLLLDPDPTVLDPAWTRLVRRFVDEFGGGLLYQPGTHFGERFMSDARMGDLVAMLPFAPDPDADLRLSERGPFSTRGTSLRAPAASANHPLIQVSGDAEASRAVWSALPEVFWTFPVGRLKPIATPLLERDAPPAQTVFGLQPVGGGRVTLLAFEGLWRWRSTAEAHYNRFWVRLVRFLAAGRSAGGASRSLVRVEQPRYDVGEYASIEARVLDDAYQPWAASEVDVEVRVADAPPSTLALSAAPDRPGWYTGRLLLEQAGLVDLRLPTPTGADPVRAQLSVRAPNVELQTIRLDESRLRRLAELTGGSYASLDDAGRLPERIASAARTDVTQRPPDDLWDNPWVLAGLAGLLSVEWFVRRRRRML